MLKFRFLSVILLILAAVASAPAQAFRPETVSYDVMFKWGLINKKAGSVTISLRKENGNYHSHLAGTSASWADRIFKVRDTLIGRMTEDFVPIRYEKIAHEGGNHKHDVVEYIYSTPGVVKAACTRKVYDKNGKVSVNEKRELEAKGKAIDMLSSFYYMRTLDYANMVPGAKVSIDIFSGKRKELLTIHYNGKRDVRIGDKSYPSYYITFTFTSKGGEKTSDDMEAWISTAPAHIPLRLEGKLPVGRVRCFYTGEV